MKTIYIVLFLIIGHIGLSQVDNIQPSYQETVSYLETHGARIANQNLEQVEGSIRYLTFEVKNGIFVISMFQKYLKDGVIKQIKYDINTDNIKSISYPTIVRDMGGSQQSGSTYYAIEIFFGIPVIGQKILKGYDDIWEELEPINNLMLKMKSTSDSRELMSLRKALVHFVELVQEREVEGSIFD